MMSPGALFFLGWAIGKAQSTSLFKWPWETAFHGTPPPQHHAPHPGLHTELPPLPDGIVPSSTSTAAPWHEARPAGLPPFPSGWAPGPTTPANVSRAWALMSTLPVNATKYEPGPGGSWLAFHASHGADGKKYVTVWHPKTAGGLAQS